ncbi:MAG: hypothetical protein JSS49_00010 [Planctomycetes bacterium]|nr:hypothetical protein [Planctomycetota bacterium]
MREFFSGWRRKAGVVSLVMACAFSTGWLRSIYRKDVIELPKWIGVNASILSLEQSMAYHFYENEMPPGRLWISFSIDHSEIEAARELFRWRWGGFGYISTSALRCYLLPYWSITIPLTILSAYLILWKPRKRTRQGHA